MFKVTARAPTRVDLGGGTLDLVPVHRLLDHAITINIGVTLYATVEIEPTTDGLFEIQSEDQGETIKLPFEALKRDERLPLLSHLVGHYWSRSLPSLRIRTKALSPAGAGLGGSSCLGVAVMAALCRARSQFDEAPMLPDDRLVQFVQDVETAVIKVPTGCQDYWGGVRGRLNILRFPPGGTQVDTLPVTGIKLLEEQLVLCYCGKSRASGRNNWDIFRAAFEGDKKILSSLNAIGAVTEEMAQKVRQADWAGVLKLSGQEWDLRRELWPQIETPETKNLNEAALKAGATFTRVCGAGGGGVMAVFCAPGKRAEVITALNKAGGRVLDAAVASEGLRVELHKGVRS